MLLMLGKAPQIYSTRSFHKILFHFDICIILFFVPILMTLSPTRQILKNHARTQAHKYTYAHTSLHAARTHTRTPTRTYKHACKHLLIHSLTYPLTDSLTNLVSINPSYDCYFCNSELKIQCTPFKNMRFC